MNYLEKVEKVRELNDQYKNIDCQTMLRELATDFDDLVLVSSFGTESAVLLHIMSQIKKDLPVLFVDTGKLFSETHTYKDVLEKKLGLTNIKILKSEQKSIDQSDPNGDLHTKKPDLCCFLRKTEPLSKVLVNTSIWISGRKRFQGASRVSIDLFELSDMRIKVNPLAAWSQKEIADYFIRHKLPRHPMFKNGYLSIGCIPCTTPVKEGEDPRSGRWRGQNKTECGIHLASGIEQTSRIQR